MAGLQTFEDYRSDLVEQGRYFSIANGHTRILIGSLVREVQRHHRRRTCPREITCKSVNVNGGVVVSIRAATEPYSKEAAKKNYKDLGAFLDGEVFGGRGANECYSFGHFLGLLNSDQSLAKKNFIRRHYSILSKGYQLRFLTSLMTYCRFWSPGYVDKLKAAIEKAGKPDNWEQVSSIHPFFRYISKRLGTKTDAVVNLLYNGLSHVNDYNEFNPQDNFSLYDLAKQIDLHFPKFIVKIQIEFDAVGMIKRFCIDEMDQLY